MLRQVFGHKNGHDGNSEPRKDIDDEDEDAPEPSSASVSHAACKAWNKGASFSSLAINARHFLHVRCHEYQPPHKGCGHYDALSCIFPPNARPALLLM